MRRAQPAAACEAASHRRGERVRVHDVAHKAGAVKGLWQALDCGKGQDDRDGQERANEVQHGRWSMVSRRKGGGFALCASIWDFVRNAEQILIRGTFKKCGYRCRPARSLSSRE